MDKRALSKLERPTATEDMFRLAERMDGNKYIATAKIIDVNGEKILLLNFFQRSKLAKKKTEAAFRTFRSRSDYITQDLTSTRVKWKTGSFKSILGWYWSTKERGHDITFASDSDFVSTRYYMKSYLKDENQNVWDAIWRFQDEVLDGRLKARHRKETDKIDKKWKWCRKNRKGLKNGRMRLPWEISDIWCTRLRAKRNQQLDTALTAKRSLK